MKPRPSSSYICERHGLQVLEKIGPPGPIEKDGEPDFRIGHRHIGPVSDVVLEAAQRSDARLVGEGNVRIHRRVGIARQRKAIVRAAQHVKEFLLANGPIACHAQGQNAWPHQREVATCIEAHGAEGPTLVWRSDP